MQSLLWLAIAPRTWILWNFWLRSDIHNETEPDEMAKWGSPGGNVQYASSQRYALYGYKIKILRFNPLEKTNGGNLWFYLKELVYMLHMIRTDVPVLLYESVCHDFGVEVGSRDQSESHSGE